MSKLTRSIKESEIEREWVLIDAEGKTFGRLVSEVAILLRGKHRPFYTPNVDCGDFVVIVNAQKVKLTGVNKTSKEYQHHTGYTGSVKSVTLGDLLENRPEKLFMLATRGMLPKTKLGRKMIKKLKVYPGAEHPHTAQVKA